MKHIFSGTINFYFVGRPEHNDIYSCLDTIPEFTLPRRKSVALVSDLVSIKSWLPWIITAELN